MHPLKNLIIWNALGIKLDLSTLSLLFCNITTTIYVIIKPHPFFSRNRIKTCENILFTLSNEKIDFPTGFPNVREK